MSVLNISLLCYCVFPGTSRTEKSLFQGGNSRSESKSYMGEENAELCPQLGRDSQGGAAPSGEELWFGLVTSAGGEVAETSSSGPLVNPAYTLLRHELLYVSGGFVAHS